MSANPDSNSQHGMQIFESEHFKDSVEAGLNVLKDRDETATLSVEDITEALVDSSLLENDRVKQMVYSKLSALLEQHEDIGQLSVTQIMRALAGAGGIHDEDDTVDS